MSWARIDDQMAFHPKMVKAGNEAVGAWARMIAYASAHLTDGFVPRDVALAIAGSKKLLDKMVTDRLLDADGDDYRVHNFLDWNPSGADVKAKRDREREKKDQQRKRAGRGGDGRYESRGPSPGDNEGDKPRDNEGDSAGDVSGDKPEDSGGDKAGDSLRTRPRPQENINTSARVNGDASRAVAAAFQARGLLVPDSGGVADVRRKVEAYVEASGESFEAVLARAMPAFDRVLAQFDVGGAPTPWLFSKHWDRVQTEMAGTAKAPSLRNGRSSSNDAPASQPDDVRTVLNRQKKKPGDGEKP
jgi:hypothetical protein